MFFDKLQDEDSIFLLLSTNPMKGLKQCTKKSLLSLKPTAWYLYVSTQICLCLLQEQYQFLYSALESVFPIQNGEVKAAKGSEADSVQIVNETKAAEQTAEEKAASITSNGQQRAAESAAPVAGKEEPDKVSTETTPLEGEHQ